MLIQQRNTVAGRTAVATLAAKLFAAALVVQSLTPTQARAEYIPPGKVEVHTERYKPENTNFQSAEYQYDVSWQGIPVASAQISVNETDKDSQPFYSVAATAETENIIAMIYRLKHRSVSVFHADSLQPVSFSSQQKERSKARSREVVFERDGKIITSAKKDGEVEEAPAAFYSDNLTLDPISAAFVARSLPVTVGTEATFDVYNGKHRYLISFLVAGRETIEVAGKTWDAFKVVPTIKKLTDTDPDTRLKSATIWISADSSRTVLKLESKVFVGSVSIELERIKPAQNPNPIRTARVQQ